MTNRQREIQDWRRFELMVSRLEQVLRPPQYSFKSPDYILDKEINELREVDGSITFNALGSERRISIECRRRTTRQDVTWIEQLATKMRALELTGTIAVCSRGFSKAAYLKAQRHGITLNTYREMQLPIGRRPFEINHLRRGWRLLSFSYEVPDGCPVISQDLQQRINAKLSSASPDTPILRIIEGGETITINQLIESALDSSTKVQTEATRTRTFKASLIKPTTLVEFPDSIPLTSVSFKLDVRMEQVHETAPIFGDYAGTNGSLLRVAKTSFERGDGKVDLHVFFRLLEDA